MKIVITGASRGIGKATAMKFASMGHHLILGAKTAHYLKKSAEEIKSTFPQCSVDFMAADLSRREEAIHFAEWTLGFGVPDLLINNAGTYLQGNVVYGPDANMEYLMNVNFYSAYHVTKIIAPAMVGKKSGHIFNMSSIAALQAYPNGGDYGVSKFALSGFSKNLRLELLPHGIRVTCLHLGAVETDSWQGFDNSKDRIMRPTEIAELIASIADLKGSVVVEDMVVRPQLGDL
jgi:short-subunit dehydrogenase